MPSLSYAEATTIVLAALTIVLACLALLVGVLAIWGYQSIKSEGIAAAEKSAERATQQAISEAISKQFDERTLSKLVTTQVKRIIRREASDASLRYSQVFAPLPDDSSKTQGSSTEHVSKEYPEEDAIDED